MTPETDMALNTARSDLDLAFVRGDLESIAIHALDVRRLALLGITENKLDESGCVSKSLPLIKPLPLLSETGYRVGQEN